jgi:MFS family permease
MLRQLGLNRNLAIISATIFLNLFARFAYYALLPLHLRSLGANDLQVGAVFTALTLARNVFGVFGGALGDRVGRRAMIAVATFAMGPFLILAGLTNDWLTLSITLFLVETCGAFQYPPLNALITESATDNRVARAFSITESAVLTGFIVGPLVGAAVIDYVNIPTLIMCNGIVLMLSGIVRGIGLREPARHRASGMMPKLRAAIDANVRWYMLSNTLVVATFSIIFGPFYAIFLRDVWRNSEAEINLLWSVGSLVSLGGIILGRMSDRWGGKRVFVFSAVVYAVMMALWGIAPTWQWGLAPLLLAFLFSEAMYMSQQTLQASITSPETRASVVGVIFTTAGLIGGLGPTFGAWLATVGGLPLTFIVAGGLGFLAMVLVLPIQVRAEK